MKGRPRQWRILCVLCGPSLESALGADDKGCGPVEEFSDLAGSQAEVDVMRHPPVEEIVAHVHKFRPDLLYLCSGFSKSGADMDQWLIQDLKLSSEGVTLPGAESSPWDSLLKAFPKDLNAVYVDGMLSEEKAQALRTHGAQNVIYWSAQSPLLPAAQFARTFFATLRNPRACVGEAFAIASHSLSVHCTTLDGEGVQVAPPHPQLLSDIAPALPTNSSVPNPVMPGLDLSAGIVAAVPGWDMVRLLAPHAEMRLLACGQSTLIDAHRLNFLGEALRAVLVLEMRALTVHSTAPCERLPMHLPAGSRAVRCNVRTCSGAQATVILGGPPNVLEEPALVEHALRQTLVADALSLQFKLPPAGVPAPLARSSAAIAGGTPVVDCLVVTSVWAVQVLRSLCQDSAFRGLVSLGVAAVGSTTVSSFGTSDATRYIAIITGALPASSQPQQREPATGSGPGPSEGGAGTGTGSGSPYPPDGSGNPPPEPAAQDGADGATGAQQGGPGPSDAGQPNGLSLEARFRGAALPHSPSSGPCSFGLPAIPPPDAVDLHRTAKRTALPWTSGRTSLKVCTEKEFLLDLVQFLRERRGLNHITADDYPDAILNGSRLDLFNLYKEVCQRGGYRVGSGINWKGQVFPTMSNFTSHHRQTGVGNALKRHYQLYLWEYEQVPRATVDQHNSSSHGNHLSKQLPTTTTQAHPEDITGDLCGVCGGGDEVATDWINCKICDVWAHLSCDPRSYLGALIDCSPGNGRSYVCMHCDGCKQAAVQ